MVEHLKLHTQEKPFSCDKCHKSFKARHSLREHVLRSHENVQKWVCMYSYSDDTRSRTTTGICNQKFSSRHRLMCHKREHDSSLKYNCTTCGIEFATKRGLQLHTSLHTGKYEFTCTACDKGFTTKSLLYEHSLIHSGEKPISCDMCDKKFSNRGTFWSHKKIHELGARPFVCKICGRSYNHRSHLAAHARKHTGERPYKCWICYKDFTLVSHLKRHMGTHDGAPKPFCCSTCYNTTSTNDVTHLSNPKFTFEKRLDLVRHYRQHHGDGTMIDNFQNFKDIPTTAINENSTAIDNSGVRLPSLFSNNFPMSLETTSQKADILSNGLKLLPNNQIPSIMSLPQDETNMVSPNVFLTHYTCELCHCNFTDSRNLETHLLIKHSRNPIQPTMNIEPERQSNPSAQPPVASCHVSKPSEMPIYSQINTGSTQNETLLIVMPDTFTQH